MADLQEFPDLERLKGRVEAFGQFQEAVARFLEDVRQDGTEQSVQDAPIEAAVDADPRLDQHQNVHSVST